MFKDRRAQRHAEWDKLAKEVPGIEQEVVPTKLQVFANKIKTAPARAKTAIAEAIIPPKSVSNPVVDINGQVVITIKESGRFGRQTTLAIDPNTLEGQEVIGLALKKKIIVEPEQIPLSHMLPMEQYGLYPEETIKKILK